MKELSFYEVSQLEKDHPLRKVQRLLAKFFEMPCVTFCVLASWDDGYGVTGYRVSPFSSMPVTILIRPNGYADLIREEKIEFVAPEI